MNREDWLLKASDVLRDSLFKQAGYSVPVLRISVGIPYGSKGLKAIGQHWSPRSSTDNVGTVFVSPVIADATRALDILVHEMVHSAVGVEHGHSSVFKRCAVAVGLTGKMTETVAGPKLKEYLTQLVSELGAYPHAKLNIRETYVLPKGPDGKPIPGADPIAVPRKKQTTRMVKQECPCCGYIVRSSKKCIDDHGPVLCPCNSEPMMIGG